METEQQQRLQQQEQLKIRKQKEREERRQNILERRRFKAETERQEKQRLMDAIEEGKAATKRRENETEAARNRRCLVNETHVFLPLTISPMSFCVADSYSANLGEGLRRAKTRLSPHEC